ncbi:MAG TPA: hypothetical protein VK932_17985, partial [Kofleriaceae bacterium]|nr:hypothetical protein [Kofleriaceae bacterium]
MSGRSVLVAATLALASAPRAGAAPPAPPAEGPVLAVTRPRSFELDLGTIARGQRASRDVSIHNP